MHRVMLLIAGLALIALHYHVTGSLQFENRPLCSSTASPKELRVTTLPATAITRRFTKSRVDTPMLNYIFDSYATSNKHFHDTLRRPSIENAATIDVSADTGHTVQLSCTVTALRDKTVSWIRVQGDQKLELLTLNLETHTADLRYRVDLEDNNWKLVLIDARTNDSGIYRCHVSTHPPMIAKVNLTIHPPEIALTPEAYLESNETLSLKCMIMHFHPGKATIAFRWYRGTSTTPLDAIRGEVLIESDNLKLTSHLQVAKIKMQDAGNYTCALEAPFKLQASARVVLLQGSSLAELQSGVQSTKNYSNLLLSSIVIVSWTFQDIR